MRRAKVVAGRLESGLRWEPCAAMTSEAIRSLGGGRP
jgi:hypothetical protein